MTERSVLDVGSPLQWEQWLETNHDAAPEVWLRLFNKSAGDVPLSYAEAVEIALCFGWIDSLARGHDEVSRIQRFSPRKPKSAWSKSNVERVQRLVAEGRMREPGQRQIDAAKADGRWPEGQAKRREETEGRAKRREETEGRAKRREETEH